MRSSHTTPNPWASFGLLAFACVAHSKMLSRRDDTPPAGADLDWSTITPNSSLSWTPCFDTFQCARFIVPLDYADPDGEQAQIALVMSPSNFTTGDESYLGPILFNPGGPGGSGVDYVLQDGALFREVLGPQFDLVGFDPRGVGQTTPPLAIFKDATEAAQLFSGLSVNANESVSALGRNFAIGEIMSNLATDRALNVAKAVGTPAVARDMLQMVEAFGQEKLQYWGISYGTVLGATFSSMFPDKVGRVLIDGVVNAHNYYIANYTGFLMDTEKALTNIYESCFIAGPDVCPIYENSTDAIRARVAEVIDDVHRTPLPLYDNSDPANIQFTTIDYSLVTQALGQALYSPYTLASTIAQAVKDLEEGNGTIIFDIALGTGAINSEENLFSCSSSFPSPFELGGVEVLAAIGCGDRIGSPGATGLKPSISEYEMMMEISPNFGPVLFAESAGPCSAWNISVNEVFNGSFVQNTSYPLMLIGNTADPITPLDFARNMSSGFAGSVVLQQNSTGHSSLSGIGECTALAIGAYFINGTLPEEGTICQAASEIFTDSSSSTLRRREETSSFHSALRGLRESKFRTRASLV